MTTFHCLLFIVIMKSVHMLSSIDMSWYLAVWICFFEVSGKFQPQWWFCWPPRKGEVWYGWPYFFRGAFLFKNEGVFKALVFFELKQQISPFHDSQPNSHIFIFFLKSFFNIIHRFFNHLLFFEMCARYCGGVIFGMTFVDGVKLF